MTDDSKGDESSSPDAPPLPVLPVGVCLLLLFTSLAWLVLAIALVMVGWHAEALREHHVPLLVGWMVMVLMGAYGAMTAIHGLLHRRNLRPRPRRLT